jgi:hypothetical protein
MAIVQTKLRATTPKKGKRKKKRDSVLGKRKTKKKKKDRVLGKRKTKKRKKDRVLGKRKTKKKKEKKRTVFKTSILAPNDIPYLLTRRSPRPNGTARHSPAVPHPSYPPAPPGPGPGSHPLAQLPNSVPRTSPQEKDVHS